MKSAVAVKCVIKKINFARVHSVPNRVDYKGTDGHVRGRANGNTSESKKSQDESFFYSSFLDENRVQVSRSLKEEVFKI